MRAEWNGIGEAEGAVAGTRQVLPSHPRHPADTRKPLPPDSLTYTAGVCSGSSNDSPSLGCRTVAANSHPVHSGAPLPGAGQSRS